MSSSIVSMNNSSLKNSPARRASRAAPDAPNSIEQHAAELTKMVKGVVGTWEWKLLEDKTKVAIVIPVDQDHRQVAKSRFVNLLEFCEDVLHLKQVVAVFERADLSTATGFPKTLRYVGFRAVAPEQLPSPLDPSTHFAMTYVI